MADAYTRICTGRKSITWNTLKTETLQAIEESSLNVLPMMDQAGSFVGTAEHANLTSNPILAILEKLQVIFEKTNSASKYLPQSVYSAASLQDAGVHFIRSG